MARKHKETLNSTTTALLHGWFWPYITHEGDPKSPFSIVTTPKCRRRPYSFSWTPPLTLDAYHVILCLVGWGCRIHRLLLCTGVRPINECPGYDTKQSDGELPVMLEHWGMRRTPSLPLLLGPLWPRVVAPDRVLSMGQIELNCVLLLNWIAWKRTVLKYKLCTYAKLNCLK